MKDIDDFMSGVVTGGLIVLILISIVVTYIGYGAYTLQKECEKDLPRTQHCVLEITAQVEYRD